MLSKEMLRVRGEGLEVAPAYLGDRDEVWIRSLLSELDGFVDRTVGELDDELPDVVAPLLDAHGVTEATFAGVKRVALRHYAARTESAQDPRIVRATAFEAAAKMRPADRHEVLAAAGRALGLTPRAVDSALFADRPRRRVVRAPVAPVSAADIVDRYNLALLQGLLARAERVTIHAREHVRSVVRYAKLSRLMCEYTLDEEGTSIEVTGPLALFHATTKYGAALARFVPALMSTPAWSLEAVCALLDRGRVQVSASAADRIARSHALPKETDSALERAFTRDVRRAAARRWAVSRETTALRVGETTFFPDFTLERWDGARVHVEIVGFYTPEYLARKAMLLHANAEHAVIVCVDESLGDALGDDLPRDRVVRFLRRVDARAVLAAAERLATMSPKATVAAGAVDATMGGCAEGSSGSSPLERSRASP